MWGWAKMSAKGHVVGLPKDTYAEMTWRGLRLPPRAVARGGGSIGLAEVGASAQHA